MLCDDLEVGGGWVEWKLKRERMHVYIELIHSIVQLQLTHVIKQLYFI